MMVLGCMSDSFARGQRSRLESILSNDRQVSLNSVDFSEARNNLPIKSKF
jgi:hypothetical protein